MMTGGPIKRGFMPPLSYSLCPKCRSHAGLDWSAFEILNKNTKGKFEDKDEPYKCSNEHCGWEGPKSDVNWYHEQRSPWKKY